MRFAAVLLPLALLTAGCADLTAGGRALEGDCGAPGGEASARGSPVWFYALNDAGRRDAVFCVQVNGGPVHRQDMPGATSTPNVKRFLGEDRAEDGLTVTAWLAGSDLAATATFPVTDENHVVLRWRGGEGLSIEKLDERPVFA